jgi:hypothetical protein
MKSGMVVVTIEMGMEPSTIYFRELEIRNFEHICYQNLFQRFPRNVRLLPAFLYLFPNFGVRTKPRRRDKR